MKLRFFFSLKILVMVIIGGLFLSVEVFAAPGINKQLNYQAVLKTDAGVKAADGDYDIIFKIYDAASGGSTLWTGTHTAANSNAVTVTDGVFSVLLGSGTGNAMTLDFNDDSYYLAVKISTDPEMTPRKRIGASGYAFNASTLGGFSTTSFLRVDAASADIFTATSTTATSTFPLLDATTALKVGADYVTDLTGVGLQLSGSALTLNATGDWTGTFDGQEGSYYSDATNLTNFGSPFYTFFNATNTDALSEGTANKYYSTLLFATDLAGTTTTALAEGTNLYWTDNRFDIRLSATTTLPNLTTLLGLINASSTQLTVTGPAYFNSSTTFNGVEYLYPSADGGSGEFLSTNGAGGLSWATAGSGSGTVGSGTTGQIPYYAANGTTLTATSSLFLSASGNVGIGTTSPYKTLSVSGELVVTASTTFNGVEYLYPSVDGSAGYVLSTDGAGDLTWKVDLSGSGGSGLFATTTDNLLLHPVDTADVLVIGSNATTTTGNIFEVIGSSLFDDITLVNATSTGSVNVGNALGLNSEYFTDLTGSGLQLSGSALTLNATGDWTGTFDGQEGSYYLNATNLTNFGSPFYTFFNATTTDALAQGSTNKYYSTLLFATNLAGTTTTALAEGTNLYYTTARANTDFDIRFAATSTTGLSEGTNLYYTDARVASVIAGTTTDALSEGSTNKYYSTSLFATDLAGTTTTALAEGTNLYWTDNRFDVRLSATTTLPNLTTLLGLTNASTTLLTVTGQTILAHASSTNQDLSGYLVVTGQTTLGNASTTNITASGYLNITGATTLTNASSTNQDLSGYLVVTGDTTLINASTTNLTASGYANIGTTLDVIGQTTLVNASTTNISASGYLSVTGQTTLVNASSTLLTVTDGAFFTSTTTARTIVPEAHLTYDLGEPGNKWNTAYVKKIRLGASSIDLTESGGSLQIAGNITVSDITATGIISVSGTATSTFTGDVAFDTNTLYVDSINNRIGIGTTTPAANLVINGTTGQNIFQVATSTNQNIFVINEDGNVGIGDVAPIKMLHIEGADPEIYLHGTSGDAFESGRIRLAEKTSGGGNNFKGGFIHFDGSANVFNIGVHDPGDQNTANDVNAISINRTTADVGIGTVAPQSKLTVADESTATGNFVDLSRLSYTNASNSDGSTVAFTFDTSSANDRPKAGIAFERTAANARGKLHILMNDTSDASDVTLSDSVVTFDRTGNVGIGVTDPFANFAVGTIKDSADNSTLDDWSLLIQNFANDIGEEIGIGFRTSSVQAANNVPGGGITFERTGSNSIGSLHFKTAPSLNLLSTRMTINSAGNVGIGTTSPDSKLHLSDAGPLQLILEADTDNTTETDIPSILFRRDGGTDSFRVGVEGTAGTAFTGSLSNTPYLQSVTATHGLQFATNGNARMTIEGGGDIGIGTTNPSAELDVIGVIEVSNEIQILDLGSATDPGITWENDGNTGIFTAGADILGFTTGGSEGMRIDASGRVGIGTTSPYSKLTVWGDSTSGASIFEAVDSASTTVLTILDNGNVGIGRNNPTDELNIHSEDTPTIRITNSTTGTSASAGVFLRMSSNDFLIKNKENGKMKFATNDTTRITIDATGNVGIGTTSPYALLSVVGSGVFTGSLDVQSTSATSTFANGISLSGGCFKDASGSCIGGGGGGSGTVESGTEGQLPFYNAAGTTLTATSTLFLTQAGNFGIGTTSPSEKFSVEGNTLINGVLTVDSCVGCGGSGFWSRSGTDTTLTNSGDNVGIGTTSPYQVLSVVGDSVFTGQIDIQGTATSTIAGDVNFDTNTLYVDSINNRIGIGTPSPNAPLEVKGDRPPGNVGGFASGILHVTNESTDANAGAVITGHNNNSTNKQLWYLGNSSSADDNVAFINRQNADLFFSTNNTARMTIDASGNVGIGTTSPDSKLHLSDAGPLQLILEADTDNATETDVPSLLFRRDGGVDSFLVGVEGSSGTAFTGSLSNTPYLLSANSTFGLQFATNGNARMTIEGGGEVGIGEVDPKSLLEITSTISPLDNLAVEENYSLKLHNSSNTNGKGVGISFSISSTDSQQTGAIVAERTGGNGQGKLNFYTKQSTSSGVAPVLAMTIDETGDVCGPDADLSNCSSDASLKENITPYEYGLNEILSLNPVKFTWNNTAVTELGYDPNIVNTGMIAQEVEQVIPDWVGTNSYGYKYIPGSGNLKYALVKAVQEQQEMIEELRALALGNQLQGNINGNLNLENLVVTNATFSGTITVRGHVTFGGDTVGTAKILAGDISIPISFNEVYASTPIVTVTPNSGVQGNYWISNKRVDGFSITLSETQTNDIVFDWHAFERGTHASLISGVQITISDFDNVSSSTDSTDLSTKQAGVPIIIINGNNPALIEVGEIYTDLGASYTDDFDDNLGIKANVDSNPSDEEPGVNVGDMSNISIDTSNAGTHTITYSVTDNAGNVGTGERIVIVEDVFAEQTTSPETEVIQSDTQVIPLSSDIDSSNISSTTQATEGEQVGGPITPSSTSTPETVEIREEITSSTSTPLTQETLEGTASSSAQASQ